MKVMYEEKKQEKIAFNRKKYCICGEHGYTIVEQIYPSTSFKWRIECPYCGRETNQHSFKWIAMQEWMRE